MIFECPSLLQIGHFNAPPHIEKALSIYAPKDGSQTIKKHHYNMQHPHARSLIKHMSQTNRPCLLCHAQLLFTTMYVMCCVHIFLFGLSSLIPQRQSSPHRIKDWIPAFCTRRLWLGKRRGGLHTSYPSTCARDPHPATIN
jgi:hypothetical protein